MTSPIPVARAGVSVSPELDKAGMAAFRNQIRAATSQAARAASRSLKQEFGRLPSIGNIDQQMAQQRTRAQQELRRTTRIYQAEANAWSSLQSQKTRSLKSAAGEQQRIMDMLSRDYDKQMRVQRDSTLAGKAAADEFTRSANGMFQQAVRTGMGMDQLGQKTSAVAHTTGGSFLDSMYRAGSAMSQIGTRVGMLGFQMQLLGRTMTNFISLPIAGSLAGASYVGLKQAAAIESAMRGMVALNPNKNVVPFFKSMLTLAEESPVFEAGPLLDALRGLSAAGLDVKKLDAVARAMANIGLTLDVEPTQMSRAFYAIKQIATKGRVYAEELRQQLGDAIPGIDSLLAEGLNMSGKQLQDMLEDKKFTADKFFKALINIGNSKRFLEGATSGAESLNAAWSGLIETSKNNLARQFLTEDLLVKPEITAGLFKLRDALTALIDGLGKAGVFEGVITVFTKFVNLITRLVDGYNSLTEAQQGMIPKFALMAAAIGPLMQLVAPFFSAIAMGIGAMGTFGITIGSIATPAGAAALAVLGVTAALTALFVVLYTKVEPFRKKFNKGLVETARLFDEHVVPAAQALWAELVIVGREFQKMGVDWGTVATAIIGWLKAVVISVAVLVKGFQVGIRIAKFFGQTAALGIAAILVPIRLATEGLIKLLEAMDKVPGITTDTSGLKKFQDGLEGANAQMLRFGREATGNVETGSFSAENALRGLGTVFDQNASKAMTLADGLDNLREKILGVESASRNSVDASDNWKSSLLQLKESVAANGRTLKDNTREGLANRDALKAGIQASKEMMLTQIEAEGPSQRAIDLHKKRVDQLVKEFGKSKDVSQATREYAGKLDEVPRNVKTLVEMMGFKNVNEAMKGLLAKQRALMLAIPIDQATREVQKDLDRNRQRGYAMGGWTGPGSKYKPAGVVHADEHVIRKEARRKIEATNPGLLDYINSKGVLPPQYADGGRVWKFPTNLSKTLVKQQWGEAGFATGGGSGGPSGMKAMFNWLFNAMGGKFSVSSGYRPGDPGYHGQGRALDLVFPDGSERTGGGLALKAFNLIKSNFMGSIKELIWDFAGSKAVWNGQNHFFTGPNAGPGTHDDHIHWAHDNGGPWEPGTTSFNGTRGTEMVFNSAQGHALEEGLRSGGHTTVNVTIGNREIKDFVVEVVEDKENDAISALRRGRRKGS